MTAREFIDAIPAEFYSGVPDSALAPMCAELHYSAVRHITAPNEGSAVALAAGYHLATGKLPAVYMQNSGIGNALNPIVSLLSDSVFGIPCLFIIGWRGMPGIPDEPQHAFQGELTIPLVETLMLEHMIVDERVDPGSLSERIRGWTPIFEQGRSAALIVTPGALSPSARPTNTENTMTRESVHTQVIRASSGDTVICTTSKASRELYELRRQLGQTNKHDFLVAGSMGHASAIALGLSAHTTRRVWCIDGDGAFLMHMGAAAMIGEIAPPNLIHIVINNRSHESVGGFMTAAIHADICRIARACGYPSAESAGNPDTLAAALKRAKECGTLSMVEARCAGGSRANLGRPAESPAQNKEAFMREVQ